MSKVMCLREGPVWQEGGTAHEPHPICTLTPRGQRLTQKTVVSGSFFLPLDCSFGACITTPQSQISVQSQFRLSRVWCSYHTLCDYRFQFTQGNRSEHKGNLPRTEGAKTVFKHPTSHPSSHPHTSHNLYFSQSPKKHTLFQGHGF